MSRETGAVPSLECQLTRKGYHWARGGHPWVYRDDLASVSGENGDVVRVVYQGRTMGTAFLGTLSKIALRWIERGEAPREPDRAFWRERLEASARRRTVLRAKTSAYRVVHDVADGIPGLIADRYGPVAVLQTTIAGTERLLAGFAEDLQPILGVEAVVARNDVTVREKEGLPREVRLLAGTCPERVWVEEEGPNGRIEYPVDPLHGQKTGAYLDQRENRWRVAAEARGRFLDAFSHGGLFALHAARRAAEVTAVDTSELAVASCEEAAARNGLSNVRCERRNVFEYLKEATSREERFDTVVLDPPAFAKSRSDVPAALRGYREVNRRAMELLAPGGILVTCSCSYNLSWEAFEDVLREAASGAKADFRLLERRTQASDHPVLLSHPESGYLKCLLLERV